MSKGSDKHFDTWHFNVSGKIEDVEVRVLDDASKIRFKAIFTPKDMKQIVCFHPDPNRLKEMIGKRIEETYKIDWEHKLHVELDSEFSEMTKSQPKNEYVEGRLLPWKAEIKLAIRCVQLGLDRNGEKIHRNHSGEHPMPRWPDVGPPDGGEDKDWNEKDMSALVDDTPENRVALQQIIVGFKTLKKRLASMMHPKRVQKTLDSVQVQKLLPPPSDKSWYDEESQRLKKMGLKQADILGKDDPRGGKKK